jgi:putative transposase
MTGRKAFQYRVSQRRAEKALDWTLDRCRELYNACLQERRDAYHMAGASVSYYDQKRQLPDVKDVRPEYRQIGSQVLQDVTKRVDRAFAAFHRVKEGATGKKVGYPRFKSKYRYNSFTLSQAGWKLPALDSGRLYITGMGHLKLKWSRPIEGTIKTVTIKRDAAQWYVTFSCEVEIPDAPPAQDKPAVGIDLGLEYFATLSTGEHIENPRHYRKAQEHIAACNRRFQTKRKRVKLKDGTYRYGKNRAKAGIALKKAHRHVANQRRDLHHKTARMIVDTYGAVAVEDLSIDNMTKRPAPIKNEDGTYAANGAAAKTGLNKSIHDAGWGNFLSILTHKAASAGVVVIR